MTPRNDQEPPVSERELLRLVGELDNGSLSAEDRLDLDRALKSSAQARRLYFEYFKLSALLHAEAEALAIEGTLPVLDGRRQQRRSFRHSLLAAAALLTVLLVVGILVIPKESDRDAFSLRAAVSSNWQVGRANGPDQDPTAGLQKGDSLRVESGTLSLRREGGPHLVVQGPATIRFPELDQPVLERGWLWVDSAEGDSPLLVKTPGRTIRDIGTRFGVRVREDQGTEIHLIEGIVDVRTGENDPATRVDSTAKGFLFPTYGDIEDVPIVTDPFPGMPGLLESGQGYATTIMSQAPSGYWRLDESSGEEGANLAPSGSTAGFDRDVVLDAPGVRPSDGFPGFEEHNSGAGLPGHSERSVIHSIDSAAGVSKEEGAVVFWIRRQPGITSPEILWWAGTFATEQRRHEIRASLTEFGHVELFIENGRSDVRLDSGRSMADDRWHHVAASWSPREVVLHVDGKLLARDGAPRATEGPVIRSKLVRFGKMGPFGVESLDHYQGRVDELSLWSRSLSAAEIAIQYRAARGTLAPEPPIGR